MRRTSASIAAIPLQAPHSKLIRRVIPALATAGYSSDNQLYRKEIQEERERRAKETGGLMASDPQTVPGASHDARRKYYRTYQRNRRTYLPPEQRQMLLENPTLKPNVCRLCWWESSVSKDQHFLLEHRDELADGMTDVTAKELGREISPPLRIQQSNTPRIGQPTRKTPDSLDLARSAYFALA